MRRDDSSADLNAYRAGWSRVLLGVLGLVFIPMTVPGFGRYWPVFLSYIASALLWQWMIKKHIGGSGRVIAGGVFDIAMITFLVQRVGTNSSLLVTLYVFIGMMNALVAKPWASRTLAALGAAAYAGVLVVESIGLLPYAPDAPEWMQLSRPTPGGVVASAILVATLLGVSTFVVGRLVSAIRTNERQLLALNARLEALSQRDPLTQLFNRRYLLDRIDLELARTRRGHEAALLMIDLDGFKRVNDRFGHLHGDDLLKRVAEAISGSIRATDVAGRYGGDEFAVLLSDTAPDQALVAAERLVRSLREACATAEPEERVTASVGVAVALGDDDSRSLLRRADEKAYRAKEHGGDRVGH